MKLFIRSIIVVFFFSPYYTSACNCGLDVPFCKKVDSTYNVFQCQVIDKPEVFVMEVVVFENINREVNSDTITILGGNGADCGLELSRFEIGDTLVLGSKYAPEFYLAQNDEYYDWYLTTCGVTYLNYHSGNVQGLITEDLSIQSYEEFKNNINDCADEPLNINSKEEISLEFSVYPSPFTNFLKLKLNGIYLKDLEVKIFNLKGRINYQSTTEFNGEIEIDVSVLKPGIYFIELQINGVKSRYKILKI